LWIPIWIPYAAVPLGMVLMAWRAIEAFVIDWKQSGKEA
jgi:TRAP-type C4-dicarboxylate transport system permease small subunit